MISPRFLRPLLPALAFVSAAAAFAAPVRHPLFDPTLLTQRSGAELRVNPPLRQEKVIGRDRPWEAFMITFYLSVLEEDGKLRLWYVCRDGAKEPNLAYAESTDGLAWTKPELGVADYHGSKANNLVGVTSLEGNVFRDPQARSARERYVYVSTVFKGGGIYRFTSPDGYRWKRDAEPFLPFEADSQNITFWDPNRARYVSYLRGWNVSQPFGLGRKVVRFETDRLDRPSGIVPSKKDQKYPKDPKRDPFIVDELPTVFAYDERDPADTDVYTSSVQPYPLNPSLYVGFPAFYRHDKRSPHRNNGWTEVHFIGSADGIAWERYDRTPYVRRGLEGTENGNMHYIGTGLVVRGDEIWQYGTGYRTKHGDVPAREQGGDGTIYRFVHRVDGFVSLDFSDAGGSARSRPVRVDGPNLRLNVDTGTLGDLRVALLDAAGAPLPGFSAAECELAPTNATGVVISWAGRSDLTALQGRDVIVEFQGRRTKLYSFRFE